MATIWSAARVGGWLGILALCMGCVGNIGSSGGDDEPLATGQGVCANANADSEPVVIRMLNAREYHNSVRDLLRVEAAVIPELPADPIVGFDNQAESLVASSLHVDKHLEAAEAVARAADLDAFAPCGTAALCIDDVIRDIGRRAFRRTITAEEHATLRGVSDEAIAKGRSPETAVRLVVETILLSPQFLYRAEVTAATAEGQVLATSVEMASRLSFFLWASIPDEALLDAAERDELATVAQVEAQARRMLQDDKAKAVVSTFHRLWLELYELPTKNKDPERFPTFGALNPLFAEETQAFSDAVFWGDSGAQAYLLGGFTFVNDALAQHYGLDATVGSDLARVSLEGTGRVGLLTQGSILSMFSNPDRTSPTKRGNFVRGQLLCQPPPPPPPDVVPTIPETATGGTVRERLAAHVENPACQSCHRLIDPVGFGLEGFDTVGASRTLDAGEPIDTTGELVDVTPASGAFDGPLELSERVAASDEFRACVVKQWFRFAAGRQPGKRDQCSVDVLVESFRASEENLPELIIQIATSNAMRLKHQEASQ